jgi:fatty acid desaturase
VLRSARDGEAVVAGRRSNGCFGGLYQSVASTAVMWFLFASFAGTAGAVVYGLAAAGVWWAMQAIAFVQHWGLGSDSIESAGHEHLGWEDRCQLQAWLTLGICYHQSHHREPTTPFYRLQPMPGSPRMPAGYVVLLLASMWPPVWRALMLRVLEDWKRDPTRELNIGRGLICFRRSADA